MEASKLPDKLENYRRINHLSKGDMACKLGISNEKYSKIIHNNYAGSFFEYEDFEKRLGLKPGSHVDTDIDREMLDTIKNLAVLVGSLIKEMHDLKEEIKGLKCSREVNESAQGSVRIPQKVPEHH